MTHLPLNGTDMKGLGIREPTPGKQSDVCLEAKQVGVQKSRLSQTSIMFSAAGPSAG